MFTISSNVLALIRICCRVALVGLLATPISAIADADPAESAAGDPKRIYIANDDHTDYFWTTDDVGYREAFLNMLDYYVDQAEDTAGNPSDSQGRFNTDGSLWLWEYERNRSSADYDRLITQMRNGKITVPLNPLVLLYGAMTPEAVIRSFYYAGTIERREDLRFRLVVPMENQTLPGGVGSLWAGCGAKYAWKGVCGCVSETEWGDRPREIYHFEGPDGRSVCMKWNTMRGANTSIGGYAEARNPDEAVDYLDNDSEFLSVWPWPVSAAFGHGHDNLETLTSEFISTSQAMSDGSRRVIVSNEIDFFEDFLADHGDEIPVFGGALGNEWDLLTASLAEVTADVKRHVEKLRTAEALASLVTMFDQTFMDGRDDARAQAFMSLGLYYEHNWTADGPVSRDDRADFHREQRDFFVSYVNELHDDALLQLRRMVHPPGGERHIVFNPLSWTRTDFVDLSASRTPPLHVVDESTGNDVPSQVVTIDGQTFVRVLASNVPSLGYKVFSVAAGSGTSFPNACSVSGSTLDNGDYAVTVGNRGQITSLIDHNDGNRQVVASGLTLHDIKTGSASVQVVNNGPVSATLQVTASGTPNHIQRITLYTDDINRIDMYSRVTENFSSLTDFDYGFNLSNPIVRHEEVGMVARVDRQANGGDYADENARTDYLTMNHFVDLTSGSRGVTLSNWDGSYFQAGSSTTTSLDANSNEISAVVGMRVSGSLGIPNQGGDDEFTNRYSLRTHGSWDQTTAYRHSLEHQNPFVSVRATGGSPVTLPNTNFSMAATTNPDVIISSIKVAEDGIHRGLSTRLWNLSNTNEMALVYFPFSGIPSGYETTHIETPLDASDQMALGATSFTPQQIRTYRLFPDIVDTLEEGPGGPPLARLRVSPNPTLGSAETRIAFTLSTRDAVRATIHDVNGRLVTEVFSGVLEAGPQSVVWDGLDAADSLVEPGVYFSRVESGDRTATAKVLRVR